MEVDNHGPIIYPQNIKKYTGFIQKARPKSINGNKKAISFCVRIRTANFKYYKKFSSRVEAEAELIRQNIKNNLEIKNTMQDCGDHYSVRLFGGKNFLVDKIDLHFIEAHIWHSSDCNYVSCKLNKKHIRFHNLILGHIPSIDASVDHCDRNTLNNHRNNL